MMLPTNPLEEYFLAGKLTARQYIYIYSGVWFSYYFMHEELELYEELHKTIVNSPNGT